jgi:hypothetical protein
LENALTSPGVGNSAQEIPMLYFVKQLLNQRNPLNLSFNTRTVSAPYMEHLENFVIYIFAKNNSEFLHTNGGMFRGKGLC